ncbi:MAG: hypothetical protein ACRDZQ_14415, partial [Acidimicrobiales bacterium]
ERYWVVRIEGVATTQARHLRELEDMTTDLIQVMTGEEHPEVTYEFQLAESVQGHLDHARQLREESARSQASAAAEARAAARELHEQGISVRDIGRVLGVSFQRAHQLVGDGERAARGMVG